MKSGLVFLLAAICEIGGCFAFWMVFRLQKPVWLLLPGLLSLMAFAWLLTLAPADAAGRAYAAYGGIYIAASLLWLVMVEGRVPDRFDLAGATLAFAGAGIILFSPRG